MELAGIIISGVGLVALESTIEDVFNKVSTWRHHGEDYQQLSLDLELARLAYERWHQTVKFADPNLPTNLPDLPFAPEREVETVKWLLGAIEAAFRDVESTTKKYETENSRTDSPAETNVKMSPMEMLTAKVRAANKARQTGTGPIDKLRWVVHDKKALEALVQKVAKNVKQLVKLFPAATREAQEGLATLELEEIVPPDEDNTEAERQQLFQLLDAAKRVDPVLKVSTDQNIQQLSQRYTARRMNAQGSGRIMNGHDVAKGATVAVPGASEDFLFEDMNVSDQAKIQNGNRIGYERGFLDD